MFHCVVLRGLLFWFAFCLGWLIVEVAGFLYYWWFGCYLLHIVSGCLHIALYVCFGACGFVVDAGCLCLLWCRLPGEGVGLFNSAWHFQGLDC